MIELLKKSIGIISDRRGQVPLCQGCEQKRSAWGSYANCWKSLGAGTTPGRRVGKKSPENGQSGPAPGTGAPARKYPALGLDSLATCSSPSFLFRGRVHRLMKAAGIHSQRKRAYKATTNSRHNCPIAPNLLQRQFTFNCLTSLGGRHHYIPTGERLAVFRHCQRPVHQENCRVCLFACDDTQLTWTP